MATRLDDNGPATRKRGNRLAVATLAFGVVGLILGVLSPPALLLGFAVSEDGALHSEKYFRTAQDEHEAAFADADVVVKQRLVNHRTAGAPIETRGCIADPRGDRVTLYSATQIPHIARFVISLVTGIPEDKLRVVAPDVGGAFGSKINVFAEEVLAVVLARRLGRPVKWIESRSENMAVVHHGRDQIQDITLAAKRDPAINP